MVRLKIDEQVGRMPMSYRMRLGPISKIANSTTQATAIRIMGGGPGGYVPNSADDRNLFTITATLWRNHARPTCTSLVMQFPRGAL